MKFTLLTGIWKAWPQIRNHYLFYYAILCFPVVDFIIDFFLFLTVIQHYISTSYLLLLKHNMDHSCCTKTPLCMIEVRIDRKNWVPCGSILLFLLQATRSLYFCCNFRKWGSPVLCIVGWLQKGVGGFMPQCQMPICCRHNIIYCYELNHDCKNKCNHERAILFHHHYHLSFVFYVLLDGAKNCMHIPCHFCELHHDLYVFVVVIHYPLTPWALYVL